MKEILKNTSRLAIRILKASQQNGENFTFAETQGNLAKMRGNDQTFGLVLK